MIELVHEGGKPKMIADVNVLEAGEGSSMADMQFEGTRANLSKKTATPLPTRRES